MPSRSPQLDLLRSDWQTAVVEGSHPTLSQSPAFVEAQLALEQPGEEQEERPSVSSLLEGLL